MLKKESFKLADIMNLYTPLSNVNLKGVKPSYAIALLKKQMEPHVESVRQSIKYPPRWNEYLTRQLEILSKYKSESGIPVAVENATITIAPDALPQVQKELEALREEFKDTLEEKLKYDEELKALLESTVELNVYKLTLDDLPEDIDTNTMEVLISCKLIE